MQVWSSRFIPAGTISSANHCPGVDVLQSAAVRLISLRITLPSWIICLHMLNGIEPVFPAQTMGSLPNTAVMGLTKRLGLDASSYSLQVSALVIQSSSSGSGAEYCSNLDRRAHFVLTDPMSRHDICLDNNSEEQQASAVPHVVRAGMEQGVI